jgi:predicted site-specific integrase-resolvase
VTVKLTTLEAWATLTYGEHAPSINTLRRWCREAKIMPTPQKHGRTYYVTENARYLNYNDPDYARLAR